MPWQIPLRGTRFAHPMPYFTLPSPRDARQSMNRALPQRGSTGIDDEVAHDHGTPVRIADGSQVRSVQSGSFRMHRQPAPGFA
jgi:hypothetical protein